jgi:ABC-2 type transport system permease protein
MLLHIIRTDWKNLAGDRSLFAIAVLFAALLAYGAYNGAQWTATQRATHAEAAAEAAARLASLPEAMRNAEMNRVSAFMDPRNPAALGARLANPYLILPPAELAPLAIGQSDLYASYIKASTQSAETVLAADEIENPHNLLSGRFDLAFVLVYLYPLLILALGYNLLSAEKEQGTLSLTLSQPVKLSTLIFGKVLARAAVLIPVAALLSALAAWAGGANPFSVPFLAWVGIIAAYGLFWLSLAILVNALNLSSAANALVLSAAWVVLALVVPGTVNLAASSLYPVPSRVEMIHAMREASKDASQRGSMLLAKYLEDHPELSPEGNTAAGAADAARTSLAVQQEIERQMQPVLARYDAQIDGQRRLVERLQFFSPAILAQSAFNNLAGTGTERYEHFRNQVTEFLAEWRQYFAQRVFSKQRMTPADLPALPQFTYQEEEPGDMLARVISALRGILFPAAILLLLGMQMLNRYRISA